jgi:DNA-directed RNA polymerase specialized sigma24 family protein
VKTAIHKISLFFALTESQDNQALALSSRAVDFFDETDRSAPVEERILSAIFRADQKRDQIYKELKEYKLANSDLFAESGFSISSWRSRIQHLKRKDVQALVLAFVLRLPQPLIANAWKITEGSLRIRLNRALVQLSEAGA